MKITKLGLKGHAPTKGSGTTMAEAVTWAESGGKVVVPFDSNNWSYQNPQWLSFVLNTGTTYTISFPDESGWLMEGGVAQVKDAGGNTVASITASYNEESGGIVTTPATVTPSGTGTYYLYVEYGGYGEGDATIRVSVTPEPVSPPSTHFLPWESGFTKKGDVVKTYEDMQSAAISPLMEGSRFASNYFMANESYGRKVIIILDNKLYWVYNGQCKLIDDSRKYIGMLTTYYDALVFDADGNMWAVGWTSENDDTRLWSDVVLAAVGTVRFPDFYTYAYTGSDLSKYFLPVLVNNKPACITRPSGYPFTMKVFEDWPSMRMFSYEKQWSQDSVICWNLAVGLDNKLYKYKMVNDNDSKCELVDGGRWKIASGAIYYHYNEQGWAVGIKDDGKLYEIYSDYENSGDTAQIRVLDETHTWRWCISSKTPLAITTDGELYCLGWRGMDYDPHFELVNLSTGNCSKAVPCSWSAGNHHAYAIIDGGLYKMVNDNDTWKVVRIGTASDWTDVIGGGFYASDNKEQSYGYAVRDNKMYAIKDDSVWELPSFTEYTGSGDSSSSSSGGALPDDSSSSSGEGSGSGDSASGFPDQVIFNMAECMTGRFSGTYTKSSETTTVDGVSYPVYTGQITEYENMDDEWTPFNTLNYKLFACKVYDPYADQTKYWWMFENTAEGEKTIEDGYMYIGLSGDSSIPELTNTGWKYGAGMVGEYYPITASTITIVNGSSGGNSSSSSSDSGGGQPSQSVTKITITSSGSSADGEWTLNPSTGNYEKGGLSLECVQDALYAWQIWDREMPEYPDLYYSTGYTFQTNNVSEILGTMEWHDVKLDDPITLTLTDTSPNSSGGESSSSSSESSSSSGGAASGINFTGTYSEDFSFTYTGTFTQTNRTIDVTEWNTQSNETMSTPYHVMSGSFHKVGHEIDYENDSEIPVDEYVTLWLVPAMNPPTYYEWLNSDDSGKVEWANDPDAMAPYYNWGIIEAADCGNEVKSTDGCLGYISEQRYTMPTIQTGDHVYSENAGGWDNCTITVS